MRKLIYTIIILVILLTTSCSSNDDRYETLDAKDVFFTYPADKVRAFAVDEDGSVYALEDKTVTVFDLNGQRISDFELISDSSINYICLGDDVLYFTSKAMDETETLYRYDLKSKQQEELISLDCFSKLKQMAYLNGNIYFSGISPDYINKQYDLWEGDEGSFNPFVYDGTVFAAYKVDEDHLDLVFDETPIGFAVTPEEELMIYAYDNEGGYYFAKLDLKNGGIEDKHYTAINDIMSFAVDSKGGIILWPSASKTSFFNTLSYLSYKDDRVVADVMPNVIALPDGIKYVKGFTFYYNIISNRIERIKNSVYVKDNPKIKIISAGNYTTDAFSAGYQVEFTDLDYEEFAMTVLSLDKNYDICYMNSRQDFSLNIKNKGSFYPLNDVPYVKEFIDSCFPYIKEAATDDNGDIWMIPIDISVPVVIYQEENCKKAGFDFAGAVNIYDMIELANKARDMDKKLYFFNRHSLMQKSLSLYLRDHKTLDTEEFRSLAEALYNFSTNSEYFGDSLALSDFASNKNNNYLFSTEDTRVYQTLEYLIDRSDLKAVSLTGSNSINSAYCIFLCVNPKSDNLDSTLEYISSICEYMMNLKDSYMLTDRSKYTDSSYAGELYAQYENSVIDFTVSDEVFTSDFGRYLNGEIDLDTLIRDAERKLTMYYNE